MREPESSEIMSKEEACRRIGLTARRLNRAARNGDIPAILIDGEVFILREPFELMLRGGGGVLRAAHRANALCRERDGAEGA